MSFKNQFNNLKSSLRLLFLRVSAEWQMCKCVKTDEMNKQTGLIDKTLIYNNKNMS